jgi:hypothetical protein
MVAYRKIPLEEVAPGSILATPLYDSQLTKLLEKGSQLDELQISALRTRGVNEVVIECANATTDEFKSLESEANAAATADEPGLLEYSNCTGCGSSIGFRPPVPGVAAQPWYCSGCGAIVYAKFDPSPQTEYRGVAPLLPDDGLIVNLGSCSDDQVDLTPPEHLQRLVRLLTSREFKGVERRRYKRYSAVVAVVAVPLGEDFRVIGKPIRMTTTNVSHDGIGLIHTQYMRVPYYAIDFSVAGLELRQAVVKLMRVRGLGPVYESGGRFVRGICRKC